jgi:hypothetical protein
MQVPEPRLRVRKSFAFSRLPISPRAFNTP